MIAKSKNAAEHIRIIDHHLYDRALSVHSNIDSARNAIVIDLTADGNRNMLIRVTNAEKQVVSMFSWYVMKGRNAFPIKNIDNLEDGIFFLQLLNFDGELIYYSTILKNMRIDCERLRSA